MKLTLIPFTVVYSLNVLGQSDPTEAARPIVEEGKLLYHAEMASWYGTDLFLEQYPERENIGGYFSYSVNDSSHCVFFSASNAPKVIGTISFDHEYNTSKARSSIIERDLTAMERDLFTIRQLALAEINSDSCRLPMISGRS